MNDSIVFCSACTMSRNKFTFAISSSDEFRVSECQLFLSVEVAIVQPFMFSVTGSLYNATGRNSIGKR